MFSIFKLTKGKIKKKLYGNFNNSHCLTNEINLLSLSLGNYLVKKNEIETNQMLHLYTFVFRLLDF